MTQRITEEASMKPFHEVLAELEHSDAPPAPEVVFRVSAEDDGSPGLEVVTEAPADPRAVYLESADVARALGITPASVKAYAARGLLTSSARTVRGCALYSTADVTAFVQARRKRGA
jgi:hypothetical protein